MKENNIKEFVCVLADNRKELIKYLKNATKNDFWKVKAKNKVLLVLECPCGKQKSYKTIKDIPHRSIRCTCNPNYWFIKYQDSNKKKPTK